MKATKKNSNNTMPIFERNDSHILVAGTVVEYMILNLIFLRILEFMMGCRDWTFNHELTCIRGYRNYV